MLVKQLMVICNCVLWAVILNCRVEAFSIRINYLWCLRKLCNSKAPPISCQQSGQHQCFGYHCFHAFREGDGTPLQYSCLENPTDGGACRLQSMGSRRVGHDWATSLSRIGEGNGNPLQCSCLENPRDRGAWWAAIYGVEQSRTRLKRLSSSSSFHARFLHLGALDIWGWVIHHYGGLSCHPLPLLTRCQLHPLPQLWQANISPGICKCPLKDSLSLLWTTSLVVPLLIFEKGIGCPVLVVLLYVVDYGQCQRRNEIWTFCCLFIGSHLGDPLTMCP